MYVHHDGDVTIQLVKLEDHTYEVTLHEAGQGAIRVDKTPSYEKAMFYYLRAICCECACYGVANVIEAMVIDTTV